MGVDVIDYTYLKKRGLINYDSDGVKSGIAKVDKQGYMELNSDILNDKTQVENSNSGSTNGFASFFDSPVSAPSPFSAPAAVPATGFEPVSPSDPTGLFGALDSAASSIVQPMQPQTSVVDSALSQSIEEIKSKFVNFELNMQNLVQRLELLEYRLRDVERGLR